MFVSDISEYLPVKALSGSLFSFLQELPANNTAIMRPKKYTCFFINAGNNSMLLFNIAFQDLKATCSFQLNFIDAFWQQDTLAHFNGVCFIVVFYGITAFNTNVDHK